MISLTKARVNGVKAKAEVVGARVKEVEEVGERVANPRDGVINISNPPRRALHRVL